MSRMNWDAVRVQHRAESARDHDVDDLFVEWWRQHERLILPADGYPLFYPSRRAQPAVRQTQKTPACRIQELLEVYKAFSIFRRTLLADQNCMNCAVKMGSFNEYCFVEPPRLSYCVECAHDLYQRFQARFRSQHYKVKVDQSLRGNESILLLSVRDAASKSSFDKKKASKSSGKQKTNKSKNRMKRGS